jgi:hypothetical protein
MLLLDFSEEQGEKGEEKNKLKSRFRALLLIIS